MSREEAITDAALRAADDGAPHVVYRRGNHYAHVPLEVWNDSGVKYAACSFVITVEPR